MRDTDDDRIYFADPDKLDSITIDVSSKRTGSSAYINEVKTYSITKENDYSSGPGSVPIAGPSAAPSAGHCSGPSAGPSASSAPSAGPSASPSEIV
jgi:hypothetical protein